MLQHARSEIVQYKRCKRIRAVGVRIASENHAGESKKGGVRSGRRHYSRPVAIGPAGESNRVGERTVKIAPRDPKSIGESIRDVTTSPNRQHPQVQPLLVPGELKEFRVSFVNKALCTLV